MSPLGEEFQKLWNKNVATLDLYDRRKLIEICRRRGWIKRPDAQIEFNEKELRALVLGLCMNTGRLASDA